MLEENAHAWVEVFFPSYGWVQFEPTASQPVLLRTTQAPEEVAPPVGGELNLNEDLQNIRDQKREPHPVAVGGVEPTLQANPLDWIKGHALGLGLGALAAALAGGLGVFVWRRNRNLFEIDNGLLLRLFGLLNGWAARLHIPWTPSMTPMEHARTFGQMLPEASEPVNRLTGLLVAQQYGRQQIRARNPPERRGRVAAASAAVVEALGQTVPAVASLATQKIRTTSVDEACF